MMLAEDRPRAIIHLNVADFAVSVERALDSRLKRRPLLIAAEGAARATVYDMSEEAYQSGVAKGMALKRALRYCPGAVVLPPHPDRYERAMHRFLNHVRPYSPQVEMTDIKGHLFVDLTGSRRLFGPARDVAARIRRAVRADLGLDPIWSTAANKLVAKVATRLVKPSGEYIVPPGREADFIRPLPLALIPGISHDERKRLDPALNSDIDLFQIACQLLQKAWQRRIRIRRIGLVCDRLCSPPAQLALFPGRSMNMCQSRKRPRGYPSFSGKKTPPKIADWSKSISWETAA